MFSILEIKQQIHRGSPRIRTLLIIQYDHHTIREQPPARFNVSDEHGPMLRGVVLLHGTM
jgi:hypothetical protein